MPYGRELMHLGFQTMAHRHGIPEKERADITDQRWERLDESHVNVNTSRWLAICSWSVGNTASPWWAD